MVAGVAFDPSDDDNCTARFHDTSEIEERVDAFELFAGLEEEVANIERVVFKRVVSVGGGEVPNV